MKKMSHIVLACVIATSSLTLASAAAAQDKGSTAKSKGNVNKDLNGFRCKDIMRMNGDERGIAMAMLHGYFLGKRGTTSYDPDVLAKVTDDFTDYCLDNPNVKAPEAFAKVYK